MNTPRQTPALTIVDNFAENPDEIREFALGQGFTDLQYMGGIYQGTGINAWKGISDQIAKFVGRPIRTEITAFRSGHEDTTLHVNIHADNVVAQWAGVYYLNLPEDCKGGTAFYSLKETGWFEMPTQEQLDEKGLTLDWLRDKWTNEDAWNLNSVAGMRYNRFIFYPSQYFHSRYPLQGWGKQEDPAHARLVQVIFFDIL